MTFVSPRKQTLKELGLDDNDLFQSHIMCDCLQAGCSYCDSDGTRTRKQNEMWDNMAKNSESFLKQLDPKLVSPPPTKNPHQKKRWYFFLFKKSRLNK